MRRVDARGPVGFGKSEVSQAGGWLDREEEEGREVGGSASRVLRIWRASVSAFWADMRGVSSDLYFEGGKYLGLLFCQFRVRE